MVHQYSANIRGDKYPTDYIVEGTDFATAAGRAVRAWRKDKGKGSRAGRLVIVLTRLDKPIDPVPPPIPQMPRRGKRRR